MNKFVCLNAFQLKIIALISMTIDHIGYFIFPDLEILRIIGRLAFVMFAFFIANGYLHTSNKLKHGLVLLIIGVVMELILLFANINGPANIFLTLALGYFIIYFLDRDKYWLIILLFLIPAFYKLDYGYYGVLVIVCSYYLFDKRLLLVFVNVCLVLVFSSLDQINITQLYSTIGLLLICLYNDKRGPNIKYLFYWYYPLHIVVINAISVYFIK